jgi:hypothetical protein
MEVPVYMGNLYLFYKSKCNGIYQYKIKLSQKNGDHRQLFQG